MQLTFGDAEGMGKRTRKEIFLAEMDKEAPWAALLALIAPHYPNMRRPGPRLGKEHRAGADTVRAFEPVDGSTAVVTSCCRISAPGRRENPRKQAKNG